MILVDSSVWIDYFKGTVTAQTETLHRLLGQERLAIGDLILTEVLQGFDNERDFNDARKMLTALTVLELYTSAAYPLRPVPGLLSRSSAWLA